MHNFGLEHDSLFCVDCSIQSFIKGGKFLLDPGGNMQLLRVTPKISLDAVSVYFGASFQLNAIQLVPESAFIRNRQSRHCTPSPTGMTHQSLVSV
ncbi:hypothetical protein [Parerythrobacter aestuarii]|uniref:hypothetical protein n=1 Tax=Parerythrobacter aestuarii TaxID=3020909 RepID=UPI0024DE9147|nr:hypothetical protein [Parerythrobacter aestuarii]